MNVALSESEGYLSEHTASQAFVLYQERTALAFTTLYVELMSDFQVNLMRSFSFRNSKGSYKGIPIIAANMDTVGTFEMALALHQVGHS